MSKSPSTLHLTNAQARQFLINHHGLGKYKKTTGKIGIIDVFKKLGCIQYDPLNVVGRNSDLVLQSRIENYTPVLLESLLYEERALIDGWDKMMAMYLTQDFPNYQRIRNRQAEGIKRHLAFREREEALDLLDPIREHLAMHKTVLSRNIKLGSTISDRWGSGKASNLALDYLFQSGEIGVHSKQKAQKIYALMSDLLPDHLYNALDPFNDEESFLKWYVKRRIGGVGLLWGRNGGGWLGHFLSDKAKRTQIIKTLLETRELVEVNVEGLSEPLYARTEDMAAYDEAIQISIQDPLVDPKDPKVSFIAPLDNMLWDRLLVEKLFGFKYTWEVYVPKAKRQYGYYVLPVLYGDRFIARFEPEHYKGEGPLKILNWWWEADVEPTEAMIKAIKNAFSAFETYLGAGSDQMNLNFFTT